MVYTTQRFKIIQNPAAQPISVGGQEGEPSPTSGYLPDWISLLFGGGLGGQQQAPPINVGVPSTGAPGLIYEPPANVSCPPGYALNNQNQCVYVPTSGVGDITQVQVPSTSSKGGQAIIKTWFKNRHTSTLEYQVQIVITGLGINVTSPALSVAAGQVAMIETTINIPSTASTTVYSGVAQLKASGTTASSFVLQDSETFSLGVGVTVGSGIATIILSKTSVVRGTSFSIIARGFAPRETITFQAKIGTMVVGNDFKTAYSTGSARVDSLFIEPNSPLGTATITARGTISGRIASKSITIIAATATTPVIVANIVPSATSVQRTKSIAIAFTNFAPSEIVDIVAKVGTTQVASDWHQMGPTGSGTEAEFRFSRTSPLGTAVITAKGRTSLRVATTTVTVLA